MAAKRPRSRRPQGGQETQETQEGLSGGRAAGGGGGVRQDIYYWSHAGHYFSMDRLGPWWAATPLSAWPTAPAERARIVADFDREPLGPERLRTFGDRRQEIVFIGIDMQQVPPPGHGMLECGAAGSCVSMP